MSSCPKCSKRMYFYQCTFSEITQGICFCCGFYWSDSETYKSNPDLYSTLLLRKPAALDMILEKSLKL